eukprot:4564449-Alexandrium_andersonii.AAC.1
MEKPTHRRAGGQIQGDPLPRKWCAWMAGEHSRAVRHVAKPALGATKWAKWTKGTPMWPYHTA